MMDVFNYFKGLTSSLKLTKGKYKFCRVSGISALEEVLNDRSRKAQVAVDDSDDGSTMQSPGGGYFNRRSVIVFILQQYDTKNMDDRVSKMNEVKSIHKKFLSKLIKDSYENPDLKFLQRDRIPYHELPGMFSIGSCGLYFTIFFDEPVELVYNGQDWE